MSLRPELVLVVDRIRCDGYGMCAELLPERIELDDWGYPIVRSGPVPAKVLEHARRAVTVCPVLALSLRPAAAPPARPPARPRASPPPRAAVAKAFAAPRSRS